MYKNLANTLFLAREVISMPTCHSTNDMATEMAQKTDTTEGLVIVCEEQTQGKGQRGNQWESTAGKNLTLSVILRPGFLRIDRQFYLNMITSLAVRSTLDWFVPEATVKVKWPNDVLANGEKVCGILIESAVSKARMEYAVAGIGLNVNQLSFKAPKATSMSRLKQEEEFDLRKVFEKLMLNLESQYLKLRAGKLEEIKSEYLQYLFGYLEKRKFLSEYRFEGTIEDVTHSGLLVIAGPKGRKEYDLKEVEFIY